MADIHARKKEEVESWTEDEVYDFMTKHFSEEVASKFKGKLSWVHVRCYICYSIYENVNLCQFKFKI